MDRRIQFFAVLGVLLSCSDSDAQIFKRRTRARQVCCLKDYGYQNSQLSSPVSATSFTGIHHSKIVENAANEVVKYNDTITTNHSGMKTIDFDYKTFSLRQVNLTNGHCRIANVSFVIHRDGQWRITFLAEQNPEFVPDIDRPKAILDIQNQFVIHVHCVADDQIIPDAGENLMATFLEPVEIPSFWMKQNSVSRMTFNGHSEQLKRQYPVVKRIKVDLQYQ